MLKDPALYILLGNTCFLFYSHRKLGRAIKATQQSVIDLIKGRVREIGPVEAQAQAVKKAAAERRNLPRPAPLNL